MSSEKETKHLRGIILSWQLWAERQIELGLMDIDQTPACFDRSSNSLKKIIEKDKTIGKSCHFCNQEFRADETKYTDNHIMFFHYSCKGKFESAEEQALRHQ